MSVYLVAGVAASTAPASLADHLPTARPRHYPSDTTDAEWAVLAPHVPAGTGRGRPITYPRRDVVDAIRHLDRTGCQWDALPADFPHYKLRPFYGLSPVDTAGTHKTTAAFRPTTASYFGPIPG
ncbi:transposase [Micromonospora sp. NBC_00389]|uniref:transposase n=1 Tax=Micromonospora sp. NBC_00389 TaxID=2903586 RepID=UPI003FA60557